LESKINFRVTSSLLHIKPVITVLLVYVDDVVLTSNNAKINAIKAHLHSRFHIKDLDLPKFFWALKLLVLLMD